MKGIVLLTVLVLLVISFPQIALSQNASYSDLAGNRTKSSSNCAISVPNAFTPNGDGINDALALECQCDVAEFRFTIYTKSGKSVYKSTNIRQKWDGYINGTPVDDGYYKWEIIYKSKGSNGSDAVELRGDIAIIR